MEQNRNSMPLPGGSAQEPKSQEQSAIPQAPAPQASMPEVAEVPILPPEAPVAPPAIPSESKSQGIKVRAIRVGLFKNYRRAVGDVFHIPSLDKLGTWMECLDPKVEAQHKVLMAEKKAKQKNYIERLEARRMQMMAGK